MLLQRGRVTRPAGYHGRDIGNFSSATGLKYPDPQLASYSTRRFRRLRPRAYLMLRVRHDLHRAFRFLDRLRDQRELIVGEIVVGLALFLLALLPPNFHDADLGEQRVL